MVGSAGIAAVAAHLVFVGLLIRGLIGRELTIGRASTFVLFWLAGYLGLPRLSETGGLFITSYVAALDIWLVFLIFKGDIRLTG